MTYKNNEQARSGHQGRVLVSAGRFSSLRSYMRKARKASVILVAIGAVGIALAACGSEKPRVRFKTAKEGLEYYNKFWHELKNAKSNDMASITKDIAAWQEMEDSVMAVLQRDTAAAQAPHTFPYEEVRSLHNAVRDEFLNRAMAQKRTLQDLLTLKMGGSLPALSAEAIEAVKAVEPFFQSLDSASLYNMDCDSLACRYRQYLRGAERQGIHSMAQLFTFMREEDRLFRSYVTHISEMDGRFAADITKATERIYAQLERDIPADSASRSDLFLYHTMRANRRLLANAQGCLADIKTHKVKTDSQRKAYQVMIIRPFALMKDLNFALLTDTQKATFTEIAKEAPPALVRLAGSNKDERERAAALPDLLIRMHISAL